MAKDKRLKKKKELNTEELIEEFQLPAEIRKIKKVEVEKIA